jgi:hypothetical protein
MKKLKEFPYEIDTAINSHEYGEPGKLETHGIDYITVERFAFDKKLRKHLWTVIEGDDGELYYSAGFHIVNRLYFVISKTPWKKETEQYV